MPLFQIMVINTPQKKIKIEPELNICIKTKFKPQHIQLTYSNLTNSTISIQIQMLVFWTTENLNLWYGKHCWPNLYNFWLTDSKVARLSSSSNLQWLTKTISNDFNLVSFHELMGLHNSLNWFYSSGTMNQFDLNSPQGLLSWVGSLKEGHVCASGL